MKLVAMMRVKNEARWIEENIRSLFPLFSQVFMLNDHSTDGTERICRAIPGVTMWDSPFQRLNEVRDKNWLLERVIAAKPDWIFGMDGDEKLAPGAQDEIRKVVTEAASYAFMVCIAYLWNDAGTVRVDGIYGRYQRPSLWKLVDSTVRFRSGFANGFHCTNVPAGQPGPAVWSSIRLLHYGYMHREDRLRKYAWYNAHDPNNHLEDCYRHVVQGDIPEVPATARLKHAGPLKLEAL